MKKSFIICLCVILFIFLSGNFACATTITPMEEVITEAEINQKITEIKEIIIGNISSGIDINTGIDIDEIKVIMKKYKLQPNSCIVEVNGKPYDLLIIEDLLDSYESSRINRNDIRKEDIQRLAAEYVNAKTNRVKVDDYNLLDTISYYSYQSEIAAVSFMRILEQFQLVNTQYDLNMPPEAALEVLPLSATAIYIDGMPYDAAAVETLQSLMRQNSNELILNIRSDLTNDVNMQFNKCISNVDSYLDWYYGYMTGFARAGEMIKGAIDRNRTAAEAVQEFMIKNYVERIGNGMSFQNFVTILQRYRDITLEQAFIYASVLEDCIIEYDDWTESTGDITGNDYMASFIVVSDYLNKVILESLPIMGMGNKLDTEGIFLLDLVNLLVNFAPGVGWIAGTVLDLLTLKLTEHWKRPEFEYQIKASIREDQRKLLGVIQAANMGEVR
jgi:hypothetical protein